MLISPPIKTGDVVVMKLITSEEIICKIVESSSNDYKISKPMTLTLANNPVAKEAGLLPMPWSFLIEEETVLTINKDKIIFLTRPRKEISNMYLQLTSNIVIPQESSLKNVTGR